MNEGNLIPNSERTPEERKKLASKMGKASAAKRRKRKDIADLIDMIGQMPLNEIGKCTLKRGGVDLTGIDPIDTTMEYSAVAGMYIAAQRGNPKAFEALTKYKAQKEKDQLEIEKLKAEIEKLKEGLKSQADIPDDGFLDAIKGTAEKTWGKTDV